MANIVDYFGKALNCKPHWIQTSTSDQETAESNHHYMRYMPDDCSVEEVYGGISNQAVNPSERGDKVVVCSSTKSFTELLGRFIMDTMKQTNVGLQQL
jgi:hypothetical protein